MHALPFDKYLAFLSIETIDNRVLLITCIPDPFKRIISFYIRNEIAPRCRTGNFAGSAPDTPGCVDKYANKFLALFSCVVSFQVVVGYDSCSNSR